MSAPPTSTTQVLDVTAAATATPSPALSKPETAAPGPVQQADIIDFILPDVTVAVGATAEWTNLDSSAYTPTRGVDCVYDRSDWDSWALGSNQSFSYQFQQKGVFAYTCRFHSWMNATVTLLADQSNAAPGSDYYPEYQSGAASLTRATL